MPSLPDLRPASDCATMAELRREIDTLDRALIEMLALRSTYIDRAIDLKPAENIPARAAKRVEEVVANVRAAAGAQGLDANLAERLWRDLIEWSIAREAVHLGDGSREGEAVPSLKYAPGADVGRLEDWPFDNPLSDYRITRGAPRTSGRIDAGGPGHDTRFGIWRCTPGAFDCTEQGDELMTILSGACTLTDHATGATVALRTGDSYFVRDGARVTWDVSEMVTKVFFGYKPRGY